MNFIKVERKEDISLVIPALVFSRIAGYFSPVYQGNKEFLWNKGKTSEYTDRLNYKIPENLK